jgi:hypothetical protein
VAAPGAAPLGRADTSPEFSAGLHASAGFWTSGRWPIQATKLMNTLFHSVLPWFLCVSLGGSAGAPADCCPCCPPECCSVACDEPCCPPGCCDAAAAPTTPPAPAAPAAPASSGCCR